MKIDIKKILGIGVGVLTVAASILVAFTNKDEFSDFLENATDDVKEIANYQTKSNNEDGIAEVVNKFIL